MKMRFRALLLFGLIPAACGERATTEPGPAVAEPSAGPSEAAPSEPWESTPYTGDQREADKTGDGEQGVITPLMHNATGEPIRAFLVSLHDEGTITDVKVLDANDEENPEFVVDDDFDGLVGPSETDSNNGNLDMEVRMMRVSCLSKPGPNRGIAVGPGGSFRLLVTIDSERSVKWRWRSAAP